jgi:hypothetical protein
MEPHDVIGLLGTKDGVKGNVWLIVTTNRRKKARKGL